ncbi:unnamed protein product [Anisakis simplex]|uniref:GPS domain-containing protein n=1 Tax=Anisakis simplex TaxID=6269 RepID=A0A0M3K6F0_ANISI|nr:unnamed protein product [Anisakis simplex]
MQNALLYRARNSGILELMDAVYITDEDGAEIAIYLHNPTAIITFIMTFLHETRRAGLSFVQAQGMTPNATNFLSRIFTVAGESLEMISMTTSFREAYSSYECGTASQRRICMQICLGTVQLKSDAFARNAYLRSFFFPSLYSMIDMNHSASNFYQVKFANPISGSFITLNGEASFRILIPLKNFVLYQYYACFVQTHGMWSGTNCESSDVKWILNSTYAVECTCTRSGYISVFVVSPPTPPPYPPYNDVLLTFKLVSFTAIPFHLHLSEVEIGTLLSLKFAKIGIKCWSVVILLQAVQAIKRAINVSERGSPVFTSFYPVFVNATTIRRALDGDGYARRMRLLINRSYKSAIGNDSVSLMTRWLQSIATSTRISIYRFKNPQLLVGMAFNFTITVPFDGEINPLSAEEIAQIIIEETQYGELDLEDRQGNALPVMPATIADVTKLIPIEESNALVIAIAVVVSTFFLASSTIISFLVILKIRTERLLELKERIMEQARNIIMMSEYNSRNGVRFNDDFDHSISRHG